MSRTGWWSLGIVFFGVVAAVLIPQSSWFALLVIGAVACAYMAGAELRKGRR